MNMTTDIHNVKVGDTLALKSSPSTTYTVIGYTPTRSYFWVQTRSDSWPSTVTAQFVELSMTPFIEPPAPAYAIVYPSGYISHGYGDEELVKRRAADNGGFAVLATYEVV